MFEKMTEFDLHWYDRYCEYKHKKGFAAKCKLCMWLVIGFFVEIVYLSVMFGSTLLAVVKAVAKEIRRTHKG